MSCHGFYSEIQYSPLNKWGIDGQVFKDLDMEYAAYKNRMTKNLVFDPTQLTLGLLLCVMILIALNNDYDDTR